MVYSLKIREVKALKCNGKQKIHPNNKFYEMLASLSRLRTRIKEWGKHKRFKEGKVHPRSDNGQTYKEGKIKLDGILWK
ncbi:jg11630 [Pararge aegeria aegeria]|uniref:Jg11630 protein n=1 Tax=Pararge aegeria aegeria TaxID=348720 RepID=A0A8S4RPD1_9NEOP|nr:jg11630 [Pararge aegeria aegeria]